MQTSSHVNLNEDGKIKNEIEQEEDKMKSSKVVSSHTVIPFNKDFTVEDLDKWVESNVPKEIIEKNEQILKQNMEDLKKSNEIIAKANELKENQEVK